MSKPFATVRLKSRSLFQQIFKQHPIENAVIELNNLLAKHSIMEVERHHISEIEERYGLNLAETFPLNLEEFYAVYLNHSLEDSALDDGESERLLHLKQLFGIHDNQINSLHRRIGEGVYTKSLHRAITNGIISREEQQLLDKLEKDLHLPKETITQIESKAKGEYIQSYIDGMVLNQLISPDEEKKLELLASNLNVAITMNSQTQKSFDLMKRYWALENLALPVGTDNGVLQKDEICHVYIPQVTMYDTPTSQRHYGTDLKTAKGIYLKIASGSPHMYTGKKTLVAMGVLYLTNKRIFFDGADKNSYIKFEKIMSISPFSGGVRINKETGKIPYFEFSEPIDTFCIILERILREK